MVVILAIGAFTTALNTTLLSPLLKPIAADFGVSAAVAGQLATLTAASAGLTALLVVPWLDRYPRGAWLGLESALLCGGTLLSVFAPNVAWLFVGRAIAGIGGAFIFAVCLAAVSDLFPDASQRNRAIGVVGTAATLGAVLGLPLVSQLAELLGWRWAVGPILPLTAILFVGAWWLPRSPAGGKGSPWRGWATGYGRVLANREATALLGVMVALSVVWFGWLIYFGAYADTVFGVGAGALGVLFFVGGGAEVAANNLTPVFLRRRSPFAALIGAAAVLSADLLGVGIVFTGAWALFPFIAIASFSSVVLFTTTSIMLLDAAPNTRGAVMAIQSAGFEVGGAAGVATVGTALAVLGDYGAVYRLLGALLPAMLFPLVLYAHRPLRPPVIGPAPADRIP